MKTELRPGERLLREGPANLQRGWETVGGKLFLTSERLVFESHAFNVQRGVTEIPVAEVTDARPVWTRFLGLLPLFPNSLAVTTKAGAEHRFVLFDRMGWAEAIDAARP